MKPTTDEEPTSRLRRICVYCGSARGARWEYQAGAGRLGRALVEREIGVVFGGGGVGLMGVLAEAVLEAEGEITGVIPELLARRELMHPEVADMRLVPDLHARKALMAELADAFIALPGGFGTFEELFETITWSQLGIHTKPIGLLNVAGYFDGLLAFVERSCADGFIKPIDRELFCVAAEPEALLEQLAQDRPPRPKQRLPKDQV